MISDCDRTSNISVLFGTSAAALVHASQPFEQRAGAQSLLRSRTVTSGLGFKTATGSSAASGHSQALGAVVCPLRFYRYWMRRREWSPPLLSDSARRRRGVAQWDVKLSGIGS